MNTASDQRETYPYEGQARQVVGRLRYPSPPPPGALVGPNCFDEPLVVLGTELENGEPITLVGRAIHSDVQAAGERTSKGDPISLFEIHQWKLAQIR